MVSSQDHWLDQVIEFVSRLHGILLVVFDVKLKIHKVGWSLNRPLAIELSHFMDSFGLCFIFLFCLLQKNDIEKEFVQLQRAHQQQQAVLKRYQARGSKITALEDTVRQQEKVFSFSIHSFCHFSTTKQSSYQKLSLFEHKFGTK